MDRKYWEYLLGGVGVVIGGIAGTFLGVSPVAGAFVGATIGAAIGALIDYLEWGEWAKKKFQGVQKRRECEKNIPYELE